MALPAGLGYRTTMQVVEIPCLRDNYAYLIVCAQTGKAVVVDPSEAAPVLDALQQHNVQLVAIWNTHHHWDHIGGNEEVYGAFPEIEVVGHSSDQGRIPCQTTFVTDQDVLSVGAEIRATVIHNPGHTSGAISYFLAQQETVFTGDTLFLGGCGRLFEGTAEQMYASLCRLAELPPATKIYCGHEYTQSNLRFAHTVEPANQAIAQRLKAAEQCGLRGLPTVPGTIAQEMETNPFLRTAQEEVATAARTFAKTHLESAEHVFAALRRWKNSF